ncbi:MAG TPA: efflux RND transporter periplasmic adaptor subunit [Acidobacteriota bacterium]|nr:efflux RND transporter periplasmic adaptor subunit [Acidobacteriota bacterium]
MNVRTATYLLGLVIAGLSLSHCGGSSGGARGNGGNNLVPAVEAVQADVGSLPLIERLSGVVRAKNQVEIYTEISATIMQVHVNDGDAVTEGQPLIQLRDTEFRERLKQARAGYQIAIAQASQAEIRLGKLRSDLERAETLAEKRLASATELEAVQTEAASAEADVALAKARVEQAQATIDEYEEALARTVIRAPVAGTVGDRNAEIGMSVNGNIRLFTLGQLDTLRIGIILTDHMLNYIEAGQRAEIQTANLPFGSAAAKLSRISPFLHPVTHSTDAEIDLPNPDHQLNPGMFVTVDVYYGESEQATLVPLSALYDNPATGATGIYVTADSLAGEAVEAHEGDKSIALTAPVAFEFVPVDVIARGRTTAGITGVEPGKWIITLGQDLLGGKPGEARVRKVDWKWVERLQHLQRENLLEEFMERQQEAATGEPTT